MQSLAIEVHFLPDGSVNVVAPQQAGADFEAAAPRLQAFCEQLARDLNLPTVPTPTLRIESLPERHVHGPETHTHTQQRAHL
jgi:hypothetical protein